MNANTGEIRRGMEVFAVDGEQIGKVVEVRPPQVTDGGGAGRGAGGTADGGDTPRASDLAGQPDAPGRGGYGPIPSGVTQDKGRGTPTAAGAATEAGDIHTTLGREAATPGAGGLDAVRGYGTPRTATQTPGLRPTASAGPQDQSGATDSASEEVTTLLDDEAPMARPGYILVQDDGVLGVDARRLHLPFSSVLDVMPGRRITINCTREDAAMRYGRGPSLDIDEDAEITPH
jgi:hypothetical protein